MLGRRRSLRLRAQGELHWALQRPGRRRDKVENARLHGLGDANVVQELGRLAQRLLERLGLRGLALEHGQIERRRLQVAVGASRRESS
eukprot:2547615-Pleurochrysis_carterae.AAC.1